MSLIEIKDLPYLKDSLNLVLNKKHKVGATFSCFDLLHSGHILMLEDSKNICDILVVGLQTDPTIDRKNKNKPVLSYEERLTMVKSIKYIDFIVKYTKESELIEILELLKPDVRILGNDYLGKDFTGKNLNIETYYHDRFAHTYSTTKLRQRVYAAEKNK
jgi:glycerol-3-phosphate cytidylyltransferase